MKAIKFYRLTILLTLFVVLFGCKDDEGPEVSPFAGNFSISEAKLAANLVIPTAQIGDYTVPANTDITALIQTALLKSITCSPASDTYIELREDNSIYFSCKGANAINAGTWEEVSSSSLTLNLNATAIPPIGFSMSITDAVVDATGISGKTAVPFQSTVIAGLIAPMTLGPSAPALFVVNISIRFTKK
ncbi:MAG: hypothetical protein MUE32_09905 [Bacteroidales bacterium]|nr:hypothetical protein [Bacteroidales bacterium]